MMKECNPPRSTGRAFWSGRIVGCLTAAVAAAAMGALFLAAACGGAGAPPPSPTASPTPQPAELGSCDPTGDAIQVLNSSRPLAKYEQPVRDAIALAVERAADDYGWRPTDPVCVHFVLGLQEWRVQGSQIYWGHAGCEDMYLKADIVNEPTLLSRLAVHEYFHIVECGVANLPVPTWFNEGVAEWEMMRLMGVRYKNWLTLLGEDMQRGRDLPLRSLVTWEQWNQAALQDDTSQFTGPYIKAAAAIAFLEEIAGLDAPLQILRGGDHGPASFEQVFQQVSGPSVDEFEARLKDWVLAHR